MTSHSWDANSGDYCIVCGITKQGYLNDYDWGAAFCTGGAPVANAQLSFSDQCCGIPSVIYLGGKWLCETCGKEDTTRGNKMDEKRLDYYSYRMVPREVIDKTCKCGALHTSTPNTHSPWCDLRTIK